MKAASELSPDVIVMDVMMPKKDGVEACREIMESLPETRVIMLTASTEADAVIEAVAAGATGYLQKVAGMDQVLGMMKGAAAGEGRLPTEVVRRVFDRIRSRAKSKEEVDLTPREKEILVSFCRGMSYVASKAVAVTSPTRYGLSSDDLGKWCRELHLSPYGSVAERVATIITHFDELRPSIDMEVDERARWYEFYEELASRNYDLLRSQHVIDKDLETEAKFEDATRYLFSEKLKHSPLQQRGSNHADGLLSLQANYLMWDNKSKEGSVRLTDHIAQFDDYMNKSEKPVPVFIVIGPEFTDDSETEALRYHAKHIDRNLALITAKNLRLLAEEWSSEGNKSRDESFPLGLLSSTGRFDRRRLGRLF